MVSRLILMTFSLSLVLISFSNTFAQNPPVLPDIDISKSETGVVDMPDDVDNVFKVFTKYTKVFAPNGKPIHIVVQPGISDDQIVHARKILVNHLTNVPGSLYGSDKTTVANALADKNSIMAFYINRTSMGTDARSFLESGINTQAQHTPPPIPEGTELFMRDDPVRDATYEEIMHYVDRFGLRAAHPTFTRDLNDAHDNARAKGLYNRNTTGEYWICGFEAYFDFWRHDPTGTGSRGEEYIPLDNFKLQALDPAMYDLVEGFLGTHWMFTANIAEEFDGTFSLTRNENSTYTNKTQYIKKAMLTGRNDSNLTGNDEDNNLFGNSGDNVITPMAGSDVVDGGPGNDVAVFSSNREDFIVHKQDERVIVEGINFMRDGYNILINIEKLQFNDREIYVRNL